MWSVKGRPMVLVINNQSGLSEISIRVDLFDFIRIMTGASWLYTTRRASDGSATDGSGRQVEYRVFTLILAFFFLHAYVNGEVLLIIVH